jgi:hypothetical protein
VKKVLAGWCFLMYLYSCDSVAADTPSLEGRYVGYFHRSGSDTAEVLLEFMGYQFKGESNATGYPVIGNGYFKQNDESINFDDANQWASNLEGSLILEGDFQYQQNIDGTIRIWKEENNTTDEYILKRCMQ